MAQASLWSYGTANFEGWIRTAVERLDRAGAMPSLERPENAPLYRTTGSTWPRGPGVDIRILGHGEVIFFPLAFLAGSGDDTYHLVHNLCQRLVQESGLLVLDRAPLDNAVDLPAPLDQDAVVFKPSQEGDGFQWSPGPDGRYKDRAHPPDDAFDHSASTTSSQMTSRQVGFVVPSFR
jgi:hypothetical protein